MTYFVIRKQEGKWNRFHEIDIQHYVKISYSPALFFIQIKQRCVSLRSECELMKKYCNVNS